MKKLLTTTLSVILFAFATKAQIQIGIKQGVNFSNFAYVISDETAQFYDSFDVKGSAGFHLGGSMNYRFTDQIGLQIEMMYSQQGARFDLVEIVYFNQDVYLVEYELKRRMNYLNFPFMLNYQTLSGLNFEGGFGLGFLLSSKDAYKTETNIAELFFNNPQLNEFIGIRDQDSKEVHYSAELYFALGVGYQLPSGLNFGMRWMTGIGNSLDESSDLYIEGEMLVNKLLQFSIGFPIYGN